MDSRPLLDPALHAVVDQYAALGRISDENLPLLRAGIAARLEAAGHVDAPDVAISAEQVPTTVGATVRVCIYRPAAATTSARRAILHLHGGGYVLGRPEISRAACIERVRRLDCIVVSVDYRLAPEAPYPAALDDCYAALRWLHANARDLCVYRARIAVAGESAGGGLAAAVALLARDRGGIGLCLQVLDAPMIDDRTALTVEPAAICGQYIWTRENSRYAWRAYLGARAGGADVPAYAAAARAEHLGGLPPTFISVGALDLFADENIEYARRLVAAGVSTELHVYPGACHGYELAPDAHATRANARDSLAALQRAFV